VKRAAVFAAAVLVVPEVAGAVEKQHHLGVDTGVGILTVAQKDGPSIGASFLAHWMYGLTDQFQIAVEGGYSIVSLKDIHDQVVMQNGMNVKLPNNRPGSVIQGSAGINYVLDVLRWVPYFGVYATTFGFFGGNLDSPRLAVGPTIAAGLDYQISRAFTVGFVARQHFPFTSPNDYTSFTQFMARAEIVWGW
jgi:hypothetical protein